jgi:two-component system, LytTR family, sensor kinase
MDRFWKYKLDHVIFWVTTVCFHMFTRFHLIAKVGFVQFAGEVFLRNALLAVVIYTNIAVLIPRLVKRKNRVLYIVSLLLCIAAYVAIKNAHDVFLYGYSMGDEKHTQFFYNTFYNLSIAVFYIAFSIALQLSREWYSQREVIRKIEIEKLNTELEYLKAQINPHFLFNSINTIYFQIDKNNTSARDTLSAFSEMLRYQLYECNGKEIPVEKEVTYLRNYVDIQRLRKDENYEITFSCRDMQGFSIAPLLLIPFIENAFKHVSHHSAGNTIRIELFRTGDTFRMKVFNTRDSYQRSPGQNGGIGLRNVRRRLELLYNGRHTLNIAASAHSFEVDLEIKLS